MKAADRTEWCQIVSMRWTPTGIEPMDLDDDDDDDDALCITPRLFQ